MSARRDEEQEGTPDKAAEKQLKLNNSGSIIVGEKGILYSPHDYGGVWYLLPVEEFQRLQGAAADPSAQSQG